MDQELFKWAIGQGAVSGVLLVFVWKYRSDLGSILKQRGDETAILTRLVVENTSALNLLSHEIRRLADRRPDGL